MEPSSRNGKRQHEQSDSENEDDNDTKPIPTAHYQISSKVARREETGVDETQAALINTSSFCDEDLKWYSIFYYCLLPEILSLNMKLIRSLFTNSPIFWIKNVYS